MTDRPTPERPLEILFWRLEQPVQALLMLDYDGTLAPFRIDPAEARPYPGVSEALDAIMAACATRVVIVTGRRPHDIVPLLGTRERPEIWGSHGWEWLKTDGTHDQVDPPQEALAALTAAIEAAQPSR